jgi:hypothetical protein
VAAQLARRFSASWEGVPGSAVQAVIRSPSEVRSSASNARARSPTTGWWKRFGPAYYEIRVEGVLDSRWVTWFGGLQTDRGVPVARLIGLTTTATLERLAADGVIGRPAAAQRPTASGRRRPRSRRPLADIVSEQRR